MDTRSIDALKNLENLSRVKQREIFCPMTKMRALVSPLMTSDDLSLRTTISSPDLYDQELSSLIYSKTRFPEIQEEISFVDFIDNLSYVDRSALIWGIFASTYGTIGKVTVKCPHCGHEIKDEITAEQILHEDSLTPWDHDVNFKEYIHVISFEPNIDGLYKLEFHTSLPTIRQHIETLKLIPTEKIKDNYEKFGNILSKTEELCSVTREIKLWKSENDEEPNSWKSPSEIHMIINRFMTMNITDDVLDDYNLHFNKYIPNFWKDYKCPNCLNEFKYFVDPEVSLFRQFLR